MNPSAAPATSTGAAAGTGLAETGAATVSTTMDREQKPSGDANSGMVGNERQGRGEETVVSKAVGTGKVGGVGTHFSDNESDGGVDSRDAGGIDSPLRKVVQNTPSTPTASSTSAIATDSPPQTSASSTIITPPAAPVDEVKSGWKEGGKDVVDIPSTSSGCIAGDGDGDAEKDEFVKVDPSCDDARDAHSKAAVESSSPSLPSSSLPSSSSATSSHDPVVEQKDASIMSTAHTTTATNDDDQEKQSSDKDVSSSASTGTGSMVIDSNPAITMESSQESVSVSVSTGHKGEPEKEEKDEKDDEAGEKEEEKEGVQSQSATTTTSNSNNSNNNNNNNNSKNKKKNNKKGKR